MNPNADAADQVVKITLEGAEWAIRLAGTGAKNLGVILFNMLVLVGTIKLSDQVVNKMMGV